MARRRAGPLAALVLLAAGSCAHGRLDWRRPDGSYDSAELSSDVYDCEQYTLENETRSPFTISQGARQWGGWGNFVFERCMEERGWKLTRVRS